MNSSDEFDWRADDSVVCRYQPALAVYENSAGSIVLRQERGELDEEDLVLLVTPENAELVASAISKLAAKCLPLDLRRTTPHVSGSLVDDPVARRAN